jgi:hypothetical protein
MTDLLQHGRILDDDAAPRGERNGADYSHGNRQQ